MKKAALLLTALLGLVLLYNFAQAPVSRAAALRQTHVAKRYQKDSLAETGLKSPALAVVADYRALDLVLLTLLFGAAAWTLLLFFPQRPKGLALFVPLTLGFLGLLIPFAVGTAALLKGDNFLDFEALAAWVPAFQARSQGAFLLGAGALLSLGGLLTLGVRWTKPREGSHGR